MNYDRIYIKQARHELNDICWRTFKKWCSENHIGILTDKGNRDKYVLKDEFEKAKNFEAVKYLMQKSDTKDSTEEVTAQMKVYSQYRTAIEKRRNTYHPKGNTEVAFLRVLKGIAEKVD